MSIRVKRVRDDPARGDGLRVLVDRIWPRGLSREAAQVDLWAKEVAPSTALRRWFAHDPAKWAEFQRRYFAELDADRGAVEELAATLRGRRRAVLLFGARDREHNNAVALARYLEERFGL